MTQKQGTSRPLNSLGGILLGLALTQILATLHVYFSNQHLYESVTLIAKAGYLPVPNPRTAIHLKNFGPAFWGGLFFTLTLGAGLSVLSFACAFFWSRVFDRSRAMLVLLLILWLGFLAALNRRGVNFMASSYFLLVPPLVFLTSLRGRKIEAGQKTWLLRIIYLGPMAVLALLWSFQLNGDIFITIRDNLLLSNAIGEKINNAYYRYTLYPAEVFKPLSQKTLKTASYGSISPPYRRRLEDRLLRWDYLVIDGDKKADLTIRMDDGFLVFFNEGKEILKVRPRDFSKKPGEILGQFSAKSDHYGLFRQATIWSLIMGLPIMLYVFVFSVLRFMTGLCMGPVVSSILTASLCLLLGLAMLAPVVRAKRSQDITDISRALSSESWQKRVGALKTVIEKKLDIGDFPAYSRMLSSPRVPERYWLSRALGRSRRPGTYQDLLSLWDDRSRNVVCMVYEGLGLRGQRSAVKQIIERLKKSEDWYIQGYAYNALRRLGWKQKKLK